MCDIILAAGFARGLHLLSRPRIKRAQGKPDASRIRWPCVQGSVERHTSIAVTTGGPSIRLSLHDEHYSLCLMCPGQPASSPVATRFALRLTVRSDGFINARLDARGVSTLRFCRTRPASAIVHGGD